jgi:hypothetical protein
MASKFGNACTRLVEGSMGSVDGLCKPVQALEEGCESYGR